MSFRALRDFPSSKLAKNLSFLQQNFSVCPSSQQLAASVTSEGLEVYQPCHHMSSLPISVITV